MLIIPPVPFQRKRHTPGRAKTPVPPSPAALTLVSASYSSFSLTLSFDRPIDISAINVATIFVDDADRSMRLQGGGESSLSDPNTVSISMSEIGDFEGGTSDLQAGADSGIVAVDDGGTWSGTEGTGLPFP